MFNLSGRKGKEKIEKSFKRDRFLFSIISYNNDDICYDIISAKSGKVYLF